MMLNDPYSELYQWLKHHKSRSYSQIMIACKSLARKYDFGELKPSKLIFDRLYRIGIFEFDGGNCYTIGPSVVVINRVLNVCTALNCQYDARLELITRFKAEESICGVVKFTYQEGCRKIFEALSLRYVYSEIDSYLDRLPNLGSVVRQFERSMLIREYYLFYDLKSLSWIKRKQEDGIGICKMDETANIYFIKSRDGDVYKIPSLSLNPEGYQVALNYQRGLLEGDRRLVFDPNYGVLQVYSPKLPVLIERLLRLLSIHRISLCYMEKVGSEFEDILIPTYNRLRRILIT